MTETINLSEHELRSLRKWLNEMFPGRPIFIHRPEAAFDRPALTLAEVVPRQFDEMGRGFGVNAQATWQIEVLGSDFWATKREVAQISERLLTKLLIPFYLWSWRYPTPTVSVLTGDGALSAGSVSVIVTAVNAEDEESLGESVVTAVSADDALEILIAPWPRQSGVAEGFRIYAGAVGSEKLEAEVTPTAGSPTSVLHVLTNLAGSGASPPTSSVFFYRFMRVESVETEILEHPDDDGIFNGFIRVATSVLSQRSFAPVHTVEEITIREELVSG